MSLNFIFHIYSSHGLDDFSFSLSSRPTLSIQQHPPSAAISIQRPAQPRDTATRITLPSHPAIGTQKPQLHTMAQVNCRKLNKQANKKTLLASSDISLVYILRASIRFGKRLRLKINVPYSQCKMIPY